jgi:hypothetical protein
MPAPTEPTGPVNRLTVEEGGSMGRVVMYAAVSVDGFTADQDDRRDRFSTCVTRSAAEE